MFITIEQILCLKAIYETGSITKASERLRKAKSAVNYSIKTLEEQLGFKVLDKSAYRPTLTHQGQEFLLKSKDLIRDYELLIENSKKLFSGIEMKLSVSVSGICNQEVIYQVIKNTMKEYPCTEITLHREILSGEKMLENDFVDIALFESLSNKIDFEYKIIDDLELPLVISREHPFLRLPKKDQTMNELTKHPHIIQRSTLQDDNLTRGVEEEALKWTVTDTHSKYDLIKNGLGWGRLPDYMIQHDLENQTFVHLHHLDSDFSVNVYLCRKKNKVHGMVNNFIWNSL